MNTETLTAIIGQLYELFSLKYDKKWRSNKHLESAVLPVNGTLYLYMHILGA